MLRLFTITIVAIGLVLSFTANRSKAADFCSVSGTDVLQQLAGPWRVSHGAGRMNAAGMSMPFPPPKDAVIDFEHMGELGAIFATGVDQVGEMLVVPTPSDLAEIANAAASGNAGGGEQTTCDSADLPVLVGTSNYPNFESVEGNFGPTACQTLLGTAMTLQYLLQSTLGLPNDLSQRISECRSVENTLESGGMTMQMVVRFSDASHGRGYLLFDGHAQGNSFQAYTPITLSRN